MPRKKLVPEVTPAVEPEATVTQKVEEAKPARKPRATTTRAKKVVGKKPAAKAVVEPVTETTAPDAVAVPGTPKPKPARASRAKKPKVAPKQVEPETEVVTEVAPSSSDPIGAAEDVSEIVVVFRPRQRASQEEAIAKEQAENQERRGRNRNRKKDKKEQPAPAPAIVAEELVVVAEEELKIEETSHGNEIISQEFNFADQDELPVPIWRPISTTKPKASKPPVEQIVGDDEAGIAPLKSKRRRRRHGEKEVTSGTTHETAEATLDSPVAPPQPKAPEKPKPAITPLSAPVLKAIIPTPVEAPQVVVRDGVPAIVRDHRIYPPLFFFGSPADEKRATTVFDELQMAAESGVHLHSLLVNMEVDQKEIEHTVQVAAYFLSKAIEADPEAQVLFRIIFQAPRGWEEKYPHGRYRNAHGDVAEPSVCDNEFWGVAEICLEQFVKRLSLLPSKNHILGVHLDRGEWFMSDGIGYDNSRAAKHGFRDWARRRYSNDEVTLRASWFDGSVRFDNLQVPEFQPEGGDGERFIRSSRKQRRYVDYHLFLSDAMVQRVADLAYIAKKASNGMFLVGTSYGYTFEWSHPGSGHLALGKLLRTHEIDIIAGPPSYRTREPGGSAPFPGPVDSFALNGKMYLSEEDFKTSLSIGHEPDDFNPSLKTPQALENVHWRGAGAALAHGSGVAWMDLWGNGWLKTHSVWNRATQVLSTLTTRSASPLGDPEVAVFIDERALAYLVDSNAFALLVQNVRESVLRAGVSAAFYLLSDLQHREKFPESKLYLFLNAWDIRPDLRAAIKNRLQKDNKVLFWLYSAGLFDAGRDSLERAREVTGIALKPQPFHSKAGTTILNRRHPLSEAFPDRSVIGGTKLEPSYFAIPESGIVLGEYSQTGLPSFVVKEFTEDPQAQWTSVFLGEPLVNPALIRALAQMAGAHVWNFHEDVVHVRAPFCTVHCTGTGPRTITLPSKFSAYNLGTQEWASIDSVNLRFNALDGSTHSFLVGPRIDIEHLLKADPAEVLQMADLPAHDLNLRIDSSNFDVPIMKLDEWIEGGDTDEVADEWFLRPQLVEEEPEQARPEESPGKVSRRRRKRRGGNRNDQPSEGRIETVVSSTNDDGFGINVMFRKRD